MKAKLLRVGKVAGVTALILFYIVGHAWRSDMLAHYAAGQKKADVSVSVSENGHVVKMESISAPGKPAIPCSATVRFEVAPKPADPGDPGSTGRNTP